MEPPSRMQFTTTGIKIDYFHRLEPHTVHCPGLATYLSICHATGAAAELRPDMIYSCVVNQLHNYMYHVRFRFGHILDDPTHRNEIFRPIVFYDQPAGFKQYMEAISTGGGSATNIDIQYSETDTPPGIPAYEVLGWQDDWHKVQQYVLDIHDKIKETCPPGSVLVFPLLSWLRRVYEKLNEFIEQIFETRGAMQFLDEFFIAQDGQISGHFTEFYMVKHTNGKLYDRAVPTLMCDGPGHFMWELLPRKLIDLGIYRPRYVFIEHTPDIKKYDDAGAEQMLNEHRARIA